MPTKLSSDAVARAIDHLVRFGDTDVFPHLVELVFLSEAKEAVVQEIADLNLDNFHPHQAIETIAPKSRYGFRIVHQLLMLETLLFTAAICEVGDELEKLKPPIEDDYGPYGYRFSTGTEPSFFLEDRNFRDWLNWQSEKVKDAGYGQIVCTDIADFYQRIYFHRIESCLDTATANKGVKRFIEKVIKHIRSRQSHGIPVGGTASRVLAEAVLADSDSALADEGFEFTRFVDDYRVFVRPEQSAYPILAFLADQLAASEGLSLNAQKTRIYSPDDFVKYVCGESGDAFGDAEKDAIDALSHALYFEEKPSEEDIAKLRSLNLLEMLREQLDEEDWDFGRVKAVLRALRLAPDPDSIEFLADRFQLLLPFSKEVVLFLDALKESQEVDTSPLLERVIELMDTGAAASVPTIRVWLLELFVRGVLKIDSKRLSKLTSNETLDNRQKYLIRGLNGDVSYFRREKTRFEERNVYEKATFLLGATCLPKDEFSAWIGAIRPNLNRPLDHLYCDWVKSKSG